MRLGFHGATSMTSDLETDVMATAHAGLKALELWAAKIDTYLSAHSLDDLKSLLAVQGVAPNQTEVWGCLSGLPHWPVSWPSSAWLASNEDGGDAEKAHATPTLPRGCWVDKVQFRCA